MLGREYQEGADRSQQKGAAYEKPVEFFQELNWDWDRLFPHAVKVH